MVPCPNPECPRTKEPEVFAGMPDVLFVRCTCCGVQGPSVKWLPVTIKEGFADEPSALAERLWDLSFGESDAPDDVYLILSLKHSPVWGEMANWWGPNSSGYTPDLKDAGRYTAKQVKDRRLVLDDGVDTLAIPERAVINGSRRMVLMGGMTKWKTMRGEL